MYNITFQTIATCEPCTAGYHCPDMGVISPIPCGVGYFSVRVFICHFVFNTVTKYTVWCVHYDVGKRCTDVLTNIHINQHLTLVHVVT